MAPTHALSAHDHDTAQRLRVAFGRLARRLRLTDAAASAGMPPARVSALLTIDRHGPLRLAELADFEGINPTMLSRIVGHLVDDGLCERRCDASDRRAAWVEVTARGRTLAEGMRAHRTDAVQSALAELSEANRAAIEQALPALESLAERLRERRP